MMHIDLPEPYKRFKRGPQVILPKDIGIIIAYSGVNKQSFCIDAGTGSGWLAVALAMVCKRVVSYDVREDFIRIAEKNKAMAKVDNLEFRNADITKGIKERDADLITLDMPSAEKALGKCKKSLKDGGMVVGYLPHVEQVARFIKRLEKGGFYDIRTYECMLRDILVRQEGIRPSTKGIWHTAYLVFAKNRAKPRLSVLQ